MPFHPLRHTAVSLPITNERFHPKHLSSVLRYAPIQPTGAFGAGG